MENHRIVEKLLKTKPETRDDDPLLYELVAHYKWWDKMHRYELLTKLDYSSIVRRRRKLQENNEDLRWDSYWDRQIRMAIKRQEFTPDYWTKLKRLFPQ